MVRLPFVLALSFVLAACAATPAASPPARPSPSTAPPVGSPIPAASPTPPASPTQSPISHGPEGLINDLRALGIEAEQKSEFAGEPISNLGVQVCVAGEPVQVYVFGTPQEAAAMASQIDPEDPSNFGTSIIEWAGTPRFWVRDRILVLYLGDDQTVEDALVSVLGDPFARGQQGPPPLRGDDC